MINKALSTAISSESSSLIVDDVNIFLAVKSDENYAQRELILHLSPQ